MEEEIWSIIESSKGKYEVSNLGKIRNKATKKVLKETKTRKYSYVSMWYGDKRVRKTVHTLVAKAFIANPHNLPQINHKDENPANNRADNLEWCTASYNAIYGTRNKRILETRKLKNSKTRPKRVLQIDASGFCVAEYESIIDASRKTKIDFSNISKCCRDNCYNKTAGGYLWRFAMEQIPDHADIGDMIEFKLTHKL